MHKIRQNTCIKNTTKPYTQLVFILKCEINIKTCNFCHQPALGGTYLLVGMVAFQRTKEVIIALGLQSYYINGL